MDFSTIEPLISNENFKNNTLSVTFTCKDTSVSHDASVQVEQATKNKLLASAGGVAKKELLRTAKRSLSRLISSALGGGTAGRMGRNITSSMMSNVGSSGSSSSSASLSGKERETAVVEAFEQVSSYYFLDKSANKLVGIKKELMLPFFAQLENTPVKERYDQSILARMLVEIAAADGNIDSDEKEFMANFLPEEVGSVDDIVKKPALSNIELQETSAGAVRETMVLLSWGLAFCDDELSEGEKSRIKEFSVALGLDDEKQDELKDMAAQYILDQMLTSLLDSGSLDSDKSSVLEVAKKLNVSEELVQKTEISFRKRKNLF